MSEYALFGALFLDYRIVIIGASRILWSRVGKRVLNALSTYAIRV